MPTEYLFILILSFELTQINNMFLCTSSYVIDVLLYNCVFKLAFESQIIIHASISTTSYHSIEATSNFNELFLTQGLQSPPHK